MMIFTGVHLRILIVFDSEPDSEPDSKLMTNLLMNQRIYDSDDSDDSGDSNRKQFYINYDLIYIIYGKNLFV